MKTAGLSLSFALLLCAQGPQNPQPPLPSQPQPPRAIRRDQPQPGPMARPGLQPGPPLQPGQMQQNRPPDYRALREYLGLSETQLRRMEMARERASREAGEKEKSLRPQIEEKRLALDELMEGSNPDATVVGRAMLEIRGLERQIRQAHERARTAELSLLTPEQRTKFKAIQDAANLPEATRQAQSLGLVPGPAQPPRILQDPPQPRMLQGPPQPRPPAR